MTATLARLGCLLLAAGCIRAADAPRERRNFDGGWKFHLGEISGSEDPKPDDSGWRALSLPHDWSIEGKFLPANASGNAYLPGGIGWYRKTFRLPESQRGRRVAIEFDGVYRDSDVWINGRLLGHRPYGYSSFAYDLTPYLQFGDSPNVLAVRVDHKVVADSRWYTGSGIYRHVWLTATDPVHVAHWGSYVATPVINDREALVSLEITVANDTAAAADVQLVTSFQDASGAEAGTASVRGRVEPGKSRAFAHQGAVSNPQLWSLAHPNLYAAVTRVLVDGKVRDEYRTPFGIRTIRFDPDRGFFLNGVPTKFQGVCIHHDLGGLGAAFYAATLEKRLRTLQSIGVNAIRCSHNPMAPELYDLCDRLGLLVMDEAFDEWSGAKKKWISGWNAGTPGFDGYHSSFDEWSTRDIEDMVLRDRNHPSIVMWSIGNEIDYPGDPYGHPRGRDGLKPGMQDASLMVPIARRLIASVKRLDGTRPVTQALADIQASNATGLANLLDVAGYNYLEQHYEQDHKTYPQRIILGSENGHGVQAWRDAATRPWVLGQFLWTGIDYLGEAPPGARGFDFGLLDFTGFRKPQSYLREALWSSRPMIYAAPVELEARPRTRHRPPLAAHWNWERERRQSIPVEVYTNSPSAELLLNGRSLGTRDVADPLSPILRWDVPWEPGILSAVAKRGGEEIARYELRTAGPPARIEIVSDRPAADPVAHLEVRIVDAKGVTCNWSALLQAEVTGNAELLAFDNGDWLDEWPLRSNTRPAFHGRALLVVRSSAASGNTAVRVSAPGLEAGEITIAVRRPD